MLIKWFGECSFLLQDSLGRRILTDPPSTISIDTLLDLNPNIITLSHYYSDTTNAKINAKKVMLADKASSYKLNFVNISGFPSFQDNSQGRKRGPNIIYNYVFDNLKICNLGYLGHDLPDDILRSIESIDILFIPVGGHFTLNSTEAIKLVHKIKPKVIIPMNYKTTNSLIYLDSCKNFITSIKSVIKTTKNSLDTKTLNSYPVTILLKETKMN
ncbi:MULTISPECIES: MBL fold metallo-hydrolase [Clostridium]|uniref:MBL fold metallo-hydrolase n=1 Tax=Clostridium cibarium TaxID=2762247 RepID=A0ABR8PWX0_9CLOT|nr:MULTISPECIES: MBL fold metallo-hydrolase [Clostridium]MBD7912673.1 MBL fold metallo-hydrolase [Clostridium cibarium]